MSHKTSQLENILQKHKNFSSFLNFIMKKIISLQCRVNAYIRLAYVTFFEKQNEINIVFCYVLVPSRTSTFPKGYSRISNKCSQECGLTYSV